jgi:hypothetical protein
VGVGSLAGNYLRNEICYTFVTVYILFIVVLFNNTDYFVSNSVFHSYTTRQRSDLHLPQVTLAMYEKGVVLFRHQNL